MFVRDAINKNPRTSLVIVLVMVIVFVSFAIQSTASNSADGVPTKSYYSDDDGASYFTDAVSKVTPFDHNGKHAVKAYVYRFGGHAPFVGYLERITPDGAKKMAALKAGEPGYADKAAEITGRHCEVKKPGGKDWFKPMSAAGSKVVAIEPPANETGELDPVFP
jgi:hypothetical protein